MPDSPKQSRSSQQKKKAPSEEKLPPHNIEAEEAVIASLVIEPQEYMPDIVQFLKPEHFFRDINRWCFEAICALWNRDLPIDQISITNELRSMGKLTDVGGSGYLSRVVERLPTTAHCLHWAELIQNMAILRRIISAAGAIAAEAWAGNASEIREVVQRCSDIFSTIHEEMGEMPFIITEFTKADSDPPRYSMKVNTVPLEVSADELLDNKKFTKAVAIRCNFVPMREKEIPWNLRVNQLMKTMYRETAPREASIENSIWEAALEILKSQPFVDTIPEFMAGLPVQKGEYIFVQGTAFLNIWGQRVKQTRNMGVDISILWSILKRLGQARKQTIRIGKDIKEAWRLPGSILNGSEPDYENIELY